MHLQDKLVGYLSFLKIGPKLLRFLPGKKARDLRNWLTIYGVQTTHAQPSPCIHHDNLLQANHGSPTNPKSTVFATNTQ